MCLGTHSILQHIIMYISTHLYIYLHASYSHIHVTKPRTCNNTTNMYQCCRYVTILRICNNTTNTYIYIDVTIIQFITVLVKSKDNLSKAFSSGEVITLETT